MTTAKDTGGSPGAPLARRVIAANAAVIAATAAAAAAALHGGAGAAVLLAVAAAGVAASVLVNMVMIGPASRLLLDMTRAMETMHKGELDCHVDEPRLDEGLRRLAASFNRMCSRLGAESLQYAERQLGSVEEERKRIGRELHDETSQTLAATLVRLDLCDQALQDQDLVGAHGHIVDCKGLISHTMEEIKLLVYDLRPVMLDDFGLVPTLRWFIKSHLQGAGPEIVTDFEEAGLRLPGEVETALYRVTQEALANAVRHAAATKVHLRLVTRPGYVNLAVIDNGRGFDAAAALHGAERGGVGLWSMKERVELVGGTINVESTVGRGTRLYVVIPLDSPQRDEER
jgi:two-component system sensor histidine kinase UhpB